jgi:hypothetical protein
MSAITAITPASPNTDCRHYALAGCPPPAFDYYRSRRHFAAITPDSFRFQRHFHRSADVIARCRLFTPPSENDAQMPLLISHAAATSADAG